MPSPLTWFLLRRDGLFYAALMNLVTARAEWLFVKTGMRHMANGFRMNTAEAYSVEEALYHIPVTFLDNWGQPKDTALKSGQRRKGGTAVRSNPQVVVCAFSHGSMIVSGGPVHP